MARILVIDDDSSIRQLWVRLLSKAGHDVLDAFDGEDGVQQFEQNDVDLVITDWTMPKKGGGEVIREVLRQNPAIKVILVTANPSEAEMELAELNVQEVFTKPVTLQTLLDGVEEVLGKEDPGSQ